MTKRIFCGRCGQKISKKKSYCDDCDISIDNFKEPYHKVPMLYLIFLIILYLMIILLYTPVIGFGAGVTLYYIFVQSILHIVAIVLTIRAIQAKKKGYMICNKCKKDISFKAKYCIYCGNKLLFGINQ